MRVNESPPHRDERDAVSNALRHAFHAAIFALIPLVLFGLGATQSSHATKVWVEPFERFAGIGELRFQLKEIADPSACIGRIGG